MVTRNSSSIHFQDVKQPTGLIAAVGPRVVDSLHIRVKRPFRFRQTPNYMLYKSFLFYSKLETNTRGE